MTIDEAWHDLLPTNSATLFDLADLAMAIEKAVQELDAEPARLAALTKN